MTAMRDKIMMVYSTSFDGKIIWITSARNTPDATLKMGHTHCFCCCL